MKAFSGVLVAVVGPSGSGKDTLMREAAAALRSNPNIVFPRRLVTRQSNPQHEDHDTISDAEFSKRIGEGDAAFYWRAHGNGYLIAKQVDDDIASGKTCVLNVSRSVLADLKLKYRNFGVVQVTVPSDVLAQRIEGRGRDSSVEMATRLDRASLEIPPGVEFVTIVNDDTIAAGSARLVEVIKSFADLQ